MTCSVCELRMKADRLERDAKKQAAATGHCFIADDTDAVRVTIYPKMTKDQRRRLLDLLVEIEGPKEEVSP